MKLRVGGVPEHFNLPWHLGMENAIFQNEGLEISWTTFKGGTGQMTEALRNNDIDVCVVLTEGIIADIVKGNPSKIISKYLNTPLIWGVFTGKNNPINYYGEIYDKNYAISRYGSGSHLMPIVDALFKGRKIKDEQFKIIKNLDGALEALSTNQSDVFYWEKYTTKPYVDKGIFKCLGEFVTPWPCFMLAATNKAIEEKREALNIMLKTLYFINKQFMASIDGIEQVSTRYEQKLEDVRNWFHSTEWSTNDEISLKMLENVLYTLKQGGVIESDFPAEKLCEKIL
ncbi:MAG: ABC transporter substrate-binding protein [Chitinophagales bacterium]|nr:ABC transporter substrate-binding protein [Chitinophagales bacterium]